VSPSKKSNSSRYRPHCHLSRISGVLGHPLALLSSMKKLVLFLLSCIHPVLPLTISSPPPVPSNHYDEAISPFLPGSFLGRQIDFLLMAKFRHELRKQVVGTIPDDSVGLLERGTRGLKFFHNGEEGVETLENDIFSCFGLVDSLVEMNDIIFGDITKLSKALLSRHSSITIVQELATSALNNCFPRFILEQYPKLFSDPFPLFSARMNAWAMQNFGVWLVGDMKLASFEMGPEDDESHTGIDQAVVIDRCKFLESVNCASICVNLCKKPTQNFFFDSMRVPLRITPNYETFECRFEFGRELSDSGEKKITETDCLAACPTKGGKARYHLT